MSNKETLRDILKKDLELDVAKLLTNLLCENILNQKYLEAIVESQLYILQQLNPQSDFDVMKELEKIDGRIQKAADEEILEAIQQIIRRE